MTASADTIVVCDDEPDVREMVGEYLARRGFEVASAANVAEMRGGWRRAASR